MRLRTVSATKDYPVYVLDAGGQQICLMQAPVGAAAAAQIMDWLIAYGVREIISGGSCGVLTDMKENTFLVPYKALRDEGTSYHYLPPERFFEISEKARSAIERTLTDHDLQYIEVITWSTDGFFRETKENARGSLGRTALYIGELLKGWRFIAATYIAFAISVAVKMIKTSVRTGISIPGLWKGIKPAAKISFFSGSRSGALRKFYEISEEEFRIKPEFSSFWIPMSNAMLNPGTVSAWAILFVTLSLPTSYVGVFSAYRLLTQNYCGACSEVYLMLEQIEAAKGLDGIRN